MSKYPFMIFLLQLEVAILFFLLSALIWHRIKTHIRTKRNEAKKLKLTSYLIDLLAKKGAVDLNTFPISRRSVKVCLEVLESFSRRFQGQEWISLSVSICEAILLKRARKWSSSFFWLKRNFAARAFALHCCLEDEERILKLMEDRRFLVRSPAALAAIHLESERGVEKILRAISSEPGYAHYFYRDVLLLGSFKVFQMLLKFASNDLLHKAVLDVLGAKSWQGLIPFLEADLNSADPVIRQLAYRVLVRNPLPNSAGFFEQGASDKDASVRIAAIKGMNLFLSEQSWAILEKGLRDPVWEVRVEAAKALKSRGERGIKILDSQKVGPGFEAAVYAKQFG